MAASATRTTWAHVIELTDVSFAGGTVSYILGGGAFSRQRIQDIFATGARITYTVVPYDPTNQKWERNRGGLLASATSLGRSVVASSNSGAAVNWVAGDLPLLIMIDSAADVVSDMREGEFGSAIPTDLPRAGRYMKDLGGNRWQDTIFDGTDQIPIYVVDVANNRIELAPYQIIASAIMGLSRADADGRVYSEVTTPTAARFPGFDIFHYSGGFAGSAVVNAWTARGSKASPALVQANDVLRGDNAYGHDGTTHQLGAQVTAEVETTFSGSVRDTRIVGRVAKGTALTEAWRVDPDRRFRVNSAVAQGQLASLTTDTSREAVSLDANNASFAGDVATLRSRRASSSNFDFLSCIADVSALGGGGADPKLRIVGDGSVAADGTYNSGGADYAEWYELTEQAIGEDWTGTPMVLDQTDGVGEKVRPARDTDDPADIIGVVSATPSIVGNAAELAWAGRYRRDRFGRVLTETVETVSWIEIVETAPAIEARPALVGLRTVVQRFVLPVFDSEGRKTGETTEDRELQVLAELEPAVDARPAVFAEVAHSYEVDRLPEGIVVPDTAERGSIDRPLYDPAWDPQRPYDPRSRRAEWVPIGLVGRLFVRAGCPVHPGWKRLRRDVDGVGLWHVR